MKVNQNTFVKGKKIILVHYEAHHVPKYHRWMQSPELQELTASEPLTLEEEYTMQEKWRLDEDKCTFIVLSLEAYTTSTAATQTEKEIDSMVGDVNLFFNEDVKTTAEIEIMIAEPCVRGQGLGKEALLTMMRYGEEVLKLTQITAKIGYANTPSLNMFRKLGFNEVSRTDIFKEVTLCLNIDDNIHNLIQSGTPDYKLEKRDSS